ncbi:HNH endonuclease [Hymenobacter ruber]
MPYDSVADYHKAVLAFDPTDLLARLKERGKIRPFSRRQDLAADDVIPATPPGFCACGCGEAIRPPRRKWASEECTWFCYAVQGILLGDTKSIGNWLKRQHRAAGEPICCQHCGEKATAYEVDHKLAVALGGGGRWLDNYQLLCHGCHVKKTTNDLRLISALRKSQQQARIVQKSLFA